MVHGSFSIHDPFLWERSDHHLSISTILPAISFLRHVKVSVLHRYINAWVDKLRCSLDTKRIIERNVLLVKVSDMNENIDEATEIWGLRVDEHCLN